MAIFTSSPALQARGIDMAAVERQRQNRQAAGTTNALRQAQLQEVQGAQGRRNQERETAKARRGAEIAVNLLETVLRGETPEVQQRLFTEAKRRYQIEGFDARKLPETFNPGQARQWIAMGRAFLNKTPEAAPSGYQQAEGGLEFTPGGPADPAQAGRLAAAKRGPDGGATPAQQANNAEIDAARQTLDRMGLDKAEILRRTQKATNTGRANPDYDPSLERLLRTATQRKVGADPDFAVIHRRYLGPAPQFSDPAGMRPLAPGVSAEEPGFIDQARDFLGFGGATSQPSPPGVGNGDTPAPAPRGGRGRAPGRGRGGAKAIQTMNIGEINALLDERGETLTAKERKAIQARLDALGL